MCYAALLLGGVCNPGLARAEPELNSPTASVGLPVLQNFPAGLRYQVFWKGIELAQATLGVDIAEDNYTAHAVVASTGFVNLFSAYASTTRTAGTLDEAGRYLPERFHTYSYHRKKTQDIQLEYHQEEDGLSVSKQTLTPPENRKKRPAVPDELRDTGLDPLSAILSGRQKIFDIIHTKPHIKSVDLRLYEGRRLSNIHVVIHGRMMREIGRSRLSTIHVSITRSPVSGYTEKELSRFQDENPTFHLFLSDNALLIPLQMKVKSDIGSILVDIAERCQSFAACVPESVKEDERLKGRLLL